MAEGGASCSTGVGVQVTVVRVLLSVPKLQSSLATLLLERLPEFAESGLSSNAVDSTSVGDVNAAAARPAQRSTIPQLLINQFRWLEHVEKPDELASKLFELVAVVGPETKVFSTASAVALGKDTILFRSHYSIVPYFATSTQTLRSVVEANGVA